MKVKEISNFYFFEYGSSTYLLVGTANLPSPPAPVKERRDPDWKLIHPFDPLPPLEVDLRATREKEDKVRNRFLSKNNVYPCHNLLTTDITGRADTNSWSLDLVRLVDSKTKSTTPLFIGKKKTGPGSYFFYRQNLFLAKSEEDVINHINPEDRQSNENNSGRERIPDDTQIFVWNRDGGACVKCGSRENLAFDHIIPHSLGGSNSRRNLQLLCDSCNLKKSNKIGG